MNFITQQMLFYDSKSITSYQNSWDHLPNEAGTIKSNPTSRRHRDSHHRFRCCDIALCCGTIGAMRRWDLLGPIVFPEAFHSHGGTPSSLEGFFQGKNPTQIWMGVPPWRGWKAPHFCWQLHVTSFSRNTVVFHKPIHGSLDPFPYRRELEIGFVTTKLFVGRSLLELAIGFRGILGCRVLVVLSCGK